MSEEQGQNDAGEDKFPSVMGKSYEVGYGKPPLETQFKPGQIGNPKGRTTAGAYVKEEINSLAAEKLTEDQLREIARNPKLDSNRRSAAIEILKSLEYPDLSDYAGLLRGENQIEDMRGMGINTAAVKRFKQKTRKGAVPAEGKEIEEIIDREIEFFDRAGEALDRICDRTSGRPQQDVKVTGDLNHHLRPHPDMSRLSIAERLKVIELLEKARGNSDAGNMPALPQ